MTQIADTAVTLAPDLTDGPAPSPVHALDPRVRILAATAFALVVVIGDRFAMLGTGLVMALTVAAAARLPAAVTARRVLAMDGIIIVALVLLPFNAVMLAFLALVGTIETATLGHALRRLRVPDKLVHLLLFTARYITVFEREYRRLRRAMKARAFRPRNTLHTWRSLGYVVGMLLVRSFERAERILAAMKCRGFDGRFHGPDSAALAPRDWAFAALWAALLALLVGL